MDVYVIGYPRSGTVWLTRLLSDVLDSPITGLTGSPVITDFCKTGNGGYRIVKTHWMAHQWNGQDKVVFIQRDPRDVAVSAAHYLNTSLTQAIETMCIPSGAAFDKTKHIFHIPGVYEGFVNNWLRITQQGKASAVRYEWLHNYSVAAFATLVYRVTGKTTVDMDIAASYNRQRFDNLKDQYPHSMRKGIVGDWRNRFKKEHGEMITEHLGLFMLRQGYIEDLNWWKSLT